MYKHKFLLQLHLNVVTMYINLTICVCRVWVFDNVIDNCTSTSPYFLMLGVIFPRTSLHRLIMFVRLVQLLKDIITWNDEFALPTFIYLRNKKCIWPFEYFIVFDWLRFTGLNRQRHPSCYLRWQIKDILSTRFIRF